MYAMTLINPDIAYVVSHDFKMTYSNAYLESGEIHVVLSPCNLKSWDHV